MKAKIDKEGFLMLERAGKLKEQGCPFSPYQPETDFVHCGDWCPHFSNYQNMITQNEECRNQFKSAVVLTCGSGRTYSSNYDELIDERNP